VAATGLGLREVTNASTFQLFGDFVARIDTSEKVVALTFDDGPHPELTPRMLDLLDQHHVKATFFMMGRNIERYPATAREVVARGHDVGNHSYSHPRLVFMSPWRVRDEIERTDRLLRGVGVSGPIYFRAPHASKFIILPYVLMQLGKTNVQSDANPEEWRRLPAAVLTEQVLPQVRPGSIIGYHEVLGDETYRSVDDVLTTLTSQGYRFETVSALLRRRARVTHWSSGRQR
jgi:peptidoglycan/xylan/chitin deacetylase (PgdA/CDA1 family)